MELATLARGLALNRVSFGAGLIALPTFAARGVPLPARLFAATVAAGSTAIAAAYARSPQSGE